MACSARAAAGWLQFRRQHPVGPYYLDFTCEDARLAIELDGGQHALPAEQIRDRERTTFLVKSGWRVLRFWNHEVLENMEGVLIVARLALTQNSKEEF